MATATTHTCAAALASGPRRGTVCGKAATCKFAGEWFCKRHKPSYPDDMLCNFGNGLPLSDIETMVDEIEKEDPEGVARIRSLNGYINIRFGSPLLKEEMPLALMAREPTKLLNHRFLAVELRSTIEYILTRPDVYDFNDFTIPELILKEIRYDQRRGIFYAKMDACVSL